MSERPREERFVELLVETEPALRSFILSQVHHWADANDILQQTSVILWRKFDQYEPGTSFRSWAFKIARFEVLNFIKKRGRSRLVFSDATLELLATEDPQEEDSLDEERHALAECLGKLDPEQRRLLTDCYEGELTMREIAQARNRNIEALYKVVQRLRATLLECVERIIRQETSFA